MAGCGLAVLGAVYGLQRPFWQLPGVGVEVGVRVWVAVPVCVAVGRVPVRVGVGEVIPLGSNIFTMKASAPPWLEG